MPNYCSNKLIIRGSKKKIEEFKQKYCELVRVDWHENKIWNLDFNKIIPEPATMEECPKKYLLRNEEDAKKAHLEWDENNPRRWFNWWEFHCNEWGVKWEAFPNDNKETKSSFTFYFDTPWGPPYGIIVKLIQDNPKLRISGRFDEPNMCIHGSYSSEHYKEIFGVEEDIINE